ncbi:30S ribosomal protein S13 [Nanoarchaeota archaeon]
MKEQTQEQKPIEKQEPKEVNYKERIVRILSEDIEGEMKIYPGLAKIKGVSWGLSNAVCKVLKIDKTKKIGSLSETEIKKISEFIKNPEVPLYLLNRRQDLESGKDKHLTGSDLELQKEFDIKRLKKIKSYRGFRHASGLPMRGQRTRSNFRKNKAKGAGIKKKSKKTN